MRELVSTIRKIEIDALCSRKRHRQKTEEGDQRVRALCILTSSRGLVMKKVHEFSRIFPRDDERLNHTGLAYQPQQILDVAAHASLSSRAQRWCVCRLSRVLARASGRTESLRITKLFDGSGSKKVRDRVQVS